MIEQRNPLPKTHLPVSMTSKILAMAISPFLVGSKTILLSPNCISSSNLTSHLLTTALLLLMRRALSLDLPKSFEIRMIPNPVGASREAMASKPIMIGDPNSAPPNPQSDSRGEEVPVEEHEDGAERGVLSLKDLLLRTEELVVEEEEEKAVLRRRRELVRRGEDVNDWSRVACILILIL
jgi:hypothetical protein